MTWSYSGNPQNSTKDAVRYLIGDTAFVAAIVGLQAGGTNYATGDSITLVNGVSVIVTAVNSGAVSAFSVSESGANGQPGNPVPQAYTSGQGSGATFNITAYAGSHQEVQDEEITWALSQRTSVYGAAADVARAIAAKYTRKVDEAAGDTRKSYSQRAKQFLSLALTLDARAFGGAPYAGGISVIDKQNNQLDTDRVQPSFGVGMQDNELPVGAAGNETPGTMSDNGRTPD